MLAWLKCSSINKGMFDNEYAVESKNKEGKNFSLFANKRIVRRKNGEAYLKVTLLERRDRESVVVLPSDPYELNSRIVVVDNSMLEEGVGGSK